MIDLADLRPRGVSGWLDAVADDPRLVHVHRLPAKEAVRGSLARPLPPAIEHLEPPGGFWSHQAEAIDLVREGHHVAIATPTASGKSRCFQVPIAEALVSDPPGTALLLYPTKALAHDQLRALAQLRIPGLAAGSYDGDNSPEERVWVRDHANVVLTNPEMLHHGLLPNHKRWRPFLANLEVVVVDELHTLRGVFGSHVGHLLRRLDRLARHYGATPRYVFASASIGEPARLASELCGQPVREVLHDGSPRGERAVVLWNPNPIEVEQARPRSLSTETVRVAASLVEAGLSTVVFCRSRRGTELVAERLRRRLRHLPPDRIRSYRSGYLPEERREIEGALSEGLVDAIVATSALELGVDIDGLDAAVLSGFPGTIASMWQQIGRSGRRGAPSIGVVVAGEDQLDQWVMSHPAEAMARPPERVVVNTSNPLVLDRHLECAAHERPLSHEDARCWGTDLEDGVRRGVLEDRFTLRRRRDEVVAVYSGRGWPSAGMSLRSSASGELRIVDDEEVPVGTIDAASAVEQTHEGAVYLHQGRAYEVTELDLRRRVVRVTPCDDAHHTQPIAAASTTIIEQHDTRRLGPITVGHGLVEVTRHVTGYRVRRAEDHALVAVHPLDLEPTTMVTTATWTVYPEATVGAALDDLDALPGTLHAVEHAAIGILPLFAICDRWDVGGLSTARSVDTGLPTIFIHDAHPGGAGVAPLAFEAVERHLAATLGVIERCRCERGCPSCVHSPKCGNGNEPLDKAGAAALLRTVLHRTPGR